LAGKYANTVADPECLIGFLGDGDQLAAIQHYRDFDTLAVFCRFFHRLANDSACDRAGNRARNRAAPTASIAVKVKCLIVISCPLPEILFKSSLIPHFNFLARYVMVLPTAMFDLDAAQQ
jgi:hypothetical protein